MTQKKEFRTAEKWKRCLFHGALSFLLSIGLLGPLLGILLPDVSMVNPSACSGLICLLLSLLSVHRLSALIGFPALAAGALGWIFLGNGMIVRLSDVLHALTLRLYGQMAALPIVSADTAIFLSVLVTLLVWMVTLPGCSWFPAMLLCVADILLLWISGADHLIPWILPALAAGMLLLIVERHPYTSPLRLIPCILLLIALAFFLTPVSGVTLDPLREKADAFRQSVLDYLFFTEPRDVFSLATEGFYPQGISQLGGKPAPSEHPVMQVSTPRTAYLRGVILNEYDGRAWHNTTGGRRFLWQSPRMEAERILLFNQELPALISENTLTAEQNVSVRMLSDGASTLFVPQRVRHLTPGGGLVPYFSNSSELFATRNLEAGDTWSVSAPLYQAGDPGLSTLIEASSSTPDPFWETAEQTCLSLPAHLEQPIFDLAHDITDQTESPYQKAYALQAWLSRNCRYTLEVDIQPADQDFVTRFLMETREGYCTYFASAMTVLCRMVGLPARYVEGYLAEPDIRGEALVTGMHAHAWTEVYFRGFGWLTFDATPSRRQSGDENSHGDREPSGEPPENDSEGTTDQEPAESPAPENTEENETDHQETEPDSGSESNPEPSTAPDDLSAPDQASEPPGIDKSTDPSPLFPPGSKLWLWIIPLLLLAGLLLRWYWTSPKRKDRRACSENERFEIWMQEIFDRLRAEEFRRRNGETPMVYFRRIDRESTFSASLAPVGECLSLIRYASVSPVEADVTMLRDTAVELRKDLSAPARLRYALKRLFIPLKNREYSRE